MFLEGRRAIGQCRYAPANRCLSGCARYDSAIFLWRAHSRGTPHQSQIFMEYHSRLLIIFALLTLAGCHSNACPAPEKTADTPVMQCTSPKASLGTPYETWTSDSGLMHIYNAGHLDFDVGSSQAVKYLERKDATPWLDPEFITQETAKSDNLKWAGDRYVRWLANASGTLHFPFYPEDYPDQDLFVEVELRPKNNPSMAVRFYKPDGAGGRVWSDPLTTDLTPGWHGYRWRVPKEYLVKDGMQLMRVSFPNTFFEGDSRVAAKFVKIGFGPSDGKTGRYAIEPDADEVKSSPKRILKDSLNAWGIREKDRIERFMIVPQNSHLRFYAAPSAWLEIPGKILVSLQNEKEKLSLAEIPIAPGECWQQQDIDLSPYANEAARISLTFEPDSHDPVFAKPLEFRADAYISDPEIRVENDEALANARTELKKAKRIVVLAVDNLRADRLWLENKQRAVNHLGRLADEGILGIVMGEGKSLVAMATSFLTSVPATVHQVMTPGTFVKTGLTTIAEAIQPLQWKSWFYSTSGLIDTTHGFAQGFDTVTALNKDGKTETGAALAEVSAAIDNSPEHSFFYVHLSELRLPHRVDDETMSEWGVHGYSGPVNEAAMNNIAVMQNPSPVDARQFEAYYDGELSKMDEDIGQFVSQLPEDTVVVLFGTHGSSLGESTLGYEQGLTPWELLTPFFFYMPGKSFQIRRQGIATAAELSTSILDLIGADMPADTKTIFFEHDSKPRADADGLTATASMNYFYRMRREGVDVLFTTGLDGNDAHKDESEKPLLKQALREKIE